MNDEEKQILNEIKKEISEGITEEVLKKVEDKLAKLNFDNKVDDAKEKAVEYIKAKMLGDTAKTKVLSSGTTGEGAELIPTYLSSEILRVAGLYGVVRANARKYPVRGLKENVPTADGVVVYRKDENASITASSLTTGYAVALGLKELVALVPFPNTFLQEPNVNVVNLIAALAGEKYAEAEDKWGLLGLAAGEGIIGNTSVPTHTLASGKVNYSDITTDDLLSALSLLNEGALANARWIMSFSVFNALRSKKDSNGRYIVQEPAGGMPATLFNVPVSFSTVMPKTSDANQANKGFIILGNLNYLVLAERQGMTMDISKDATITISGTDYNLFQNNMSAVRFVNYVDIKVAEPTKAFVVIKTAAS